MSALRALAEGTGRLNASPSTAPLSPTDIAARIMAQADANGPCGPKRGAIHASEYFAVYSDALSSHVLRTGRFPEQRGALLLLGMNGPVMLFPAVDVPVGAIRWEPSE